MFTRGVRHAADDRTRRAGRRGRSALDRPPNCCSRATVPASSARARAAKSKWVNALQRASRQWRRSPRLASIAPVPPTYILGISAFYHDSAACLLRDGAIVAAAQEERFTRKKGASDFPRRAAQYCLNAAGIQPADLAYVGFYDKPLLKFERILETYLGVAPRGFSQFRLAGPAWMKEKLFQDREIRNALGYDGEVLYAEHHESHAASAFFPSPFEEAAILTLDGVGEWDTASLGTGRGNRIEISQVMHFPHSLGLLYSAFTYFTGFKVNSGEYKLMGLAPYGEPKVTGMTDLCLAGGVALNCVGNGVLLREGPFENIWIQPAAGDAGGALGAALFTWFQLLGNKRTPVPRDSQKGSLLGPRYSDEHI